MSDLDRAKAILTALADASATGDYALVDDLVSEFEAEVAAVEDRATAAEHAGKLVTALGHLGVVLAQLPALIFGRLEEDGVEVPEEAVASFGDARTTMSTTFTNLAGVEPDE